MDQPAHRRDPPQELDAKTAYLVMTGAAIDRVHFLDEQRRNRRRSLRFSAFAVVAVGLAGIPLCVLVSPLLFGIALVGAHVLDLIAPLSDARWDRLHDVAFALPNVWTRIRGRPVPASIWVPRSKCSRGT